MENKELNKDLEKSIIEEENKTQTEEKKIKVPEGYYMGTNGVIYPIGTTQFGIATHIAPNTTINVNTEKKTKTGKKIGAFVTAIILTILGIAATIYAVMSFTSFLAGINSENAGVAILLILLFVTVGCVFYIPAVAFAGSGLGFSISAVKSTKKSIKAFSILLIIINSLCILGLLVIFGWLLIYPILV